MYHSGIRGSAVMAKVEQDEEREERINYDIKYRMGRDSGGDD